MERISPNPHEKEMDLIPTPIPNPTPSSDPTPDTGTLPPDSLLGLAASSSDPRKRTPQLLATFFFEIHRVLVLLGRCTEAELEAQHQSYGPAKLPSVEDDLFYRTLVKTVFNSGFRPNVIDRYLPTIEKYFSDYKTVMNYDEHQLEEILKDPDMIKNKAKIQACFHNAKTMHVLVKQRGSIQHYLNEFRLYGDNDNIYYHLMRVDLLINFCYLGEMTVLNFITDLGYDVFKPDKVVMRALDQLNLIDDMYDYFQALEMARGMSEGARLPLSYVVKVLKLYGQ